jgi:hypothetical protein
MDFSIGGRSIVLKIAGRSWIAIAILHSVIGVVGYYPQWRAIAQSGWFNVVAPNPLAPFFDREDALWFMMLTPFLVILGQLCLWADRQKLTLPISVGGTLLVSAIVGLFFIPISGFWLMLIPSGMMLYTSQGFALSDPNIRIH